MAYERKMGLRHYRKMTGMNVTKIVNLVEDNDMSTKTWYKMENNDSTVTVEKWYRALNTLNDIKIFEKNPLSLEDIKSDEGNK